MGVVSRSHTDRSVPLAESATAARLAPEALLALVLVVTLESFRLLLPTLYGLKERDGLQVTLAVVLVVALLPFAAPLLTRAVGHRRAVAAAVVVLAVWRLGVQVIGAVPVPLAALGVVAGLTAFALVVAAPLVDRRVVTVGIAGGLAADVVLLGAFATWEPAWQSGLVPFVAAAAVAALLLGSSALVVDAWPDGDSTPPAGPALPGGVALGAVIGLELLFLANPGYLAAASGYQIGLAIAIASFGVVAFLAAAVLLPLDAAGSTWAGVVVLGLAGFVLPEVAGPAAVAVVLLAQAGAGVVVVRAVASRSTSVAAAEIGVVLGWFATIVALLLFQLHYDQPLPIDNQLVTAALGLLTGAALLAPSTVAGDESPELWWPAPAVLGLFAVPGVVVALALAATGPAAGAVADAGAPVRVAQWNVRQAVDGDGQLDPEALADAIGAAGPVDVVVLDEVGRGWPLSGQLDLASWLSRRLDLRYVWGGAASQQFGNLVLSRYPVQSSQVTELPVAGDSQGRSLLQVELAGPGGETFTVLATHLQHRNSPEAVEARLEEVDLVLDAWGGATRTVVVGDLNPRQGDPPEYPPRVPGEFVELVPLLDAGFTTGADLTACSVPTTDVNCSDFILVSPDLEATSYDVGPMFGDHHLIVTDVTGA